MTPDYEFDFSPAPTVRLLTAGPHRLPSKPLHKGCPLGDCYVGHDGLSDCLEKACPRCGAQDLYEKRCLVCGGSL
jgi:hypothetical protein